jgi:predicted nucleotidyltransferase
MKRNEGVLRASWQAINGMPKQIRKKECDMIENVLFSTIIGSHVWNMNTKMSDTDIFEAYIAPTEDILKGIANTKSKFIQKDGFDIAQHEVGKVIAQLLKGNVNFIVGVMSPLCTTSFKTYHADLMEIVSMQMAKNCYYSIHGMALHNYKKYIESGIYTSERLGNKILRVLKFGQRILMGEGISFEKVEDGTPDEIELQLKRLDATFDISTLQDKPKEEPFRDWLYQVRLNEWETNHG